MLTEFSEPLLVEPRPSRLLQALTAGVHAVALIPALLLPMPVWARLLWLIAVLVSLAWEWRCQVGPAAVARLPSFRCSDGEWQWARDGEWVPARLGRWYATPTLCVLRFRTPRRTVVLARDSVDADCHRRVRVLLRARDTTSPSYWALLLRRFSRREGHDLEPRA